MIGPVCGIFIMTFLEVLSHNDNSKSNFLVLGEGPTHGINGSSGLAEKNFSLNFINPETNFDLSSHYNGDNTCLLNEKKIEFKTGNNNVNFLIQFCL